MFKNSRVGWKILSRNVRYNSVVIDRELQSSFGFLPRLSAIQKLFSEKAFRDSYKDLIAKDVISPNNPVIGLIAFADLQNPLLKKYDFDPADFVIGATEAFTQLHRALASRDFANYISGFSRTSTSNDLLEATLSPNLYTASKNATEVMGRSGFTINMTELDLKRSFLAGVTTKVVEGTPLSKTTLEEIIKSKNLLTKMLAQTLEKPPAENDTASETTASVVAVDVVDSTNDASKASGASAAANTAVVTNNKSEEELKAMSESVLNTVATIANDPALIESIEKNTHQIVLTESEREALKSATVKVAIDGDKIITLGTSPDDLRKEDINLEDDYYFIDDHLAQYPIGSVVASVDVYFETFETYINRVETEEVSDEKEMSRNYKTKWTFEACISGHKEMDWQVVAFDGLGNNNHKNGKLVRVEKPPVLAAAAAVDGAAVVRSSGKKVE